MPIDFSAYAPTTVLRVRCRDGGEGLLSANRDDSNWSNFLLRDDGKTEWCNNRGETNPFSETDRDVAEIIGEMVLVQGN